MFVILYIFIIIIISSSSSMITIMMRHLQRHDARDHGGGRGISRAGSVGKCQDFKVTLSIYLIVA